MNHPRRLTPSWDLASKSTTLVIKNFTPLIYLVVLPSLLNVLGSLMVTGLVTLDLQVVLNEQRAIGLSIIGISLLWSFVNIGPLTHFVLDAMDDRTQQLRAYYRHGLIDSFRLFGLYAVSFVAIIVGFALFIIPGFIMLRWFILAPYYVVDKRLGIFAALSSSRHASKPVSGYIWGTIAVQWGVTLLGFLLGAVPLIGALLTQAVALGITFLLPLRYRSIEATPSADTRAD